MSEKKEYKRRSAELFDEFVEQSKFEFPIVIEYTEGANRYTRGDIEAFFENGVRAYISVKDRACVFSKTKFIAKYATSSEESKIEYELFIKTLMYIHKVVPPEEFNRRHEEMTKINEILDGLSFEDNFRQANLNVREENPQGVAKPKIKIEEDEKETVIIAKEGDEPDPF